MARFRVQLVGYVVVDADNGADARAVALEGLPAGRVWCTGEDVARVDGVVVDLAFERFRRCLPPAVEKIRQAPDPAETPLMRRIRENRERLSGR